MLKRIPILPTLLVLIAVGVMVRLGFWQLDRLHQKEAMLVRYQSNYLLPDIAFPTGPGDEAALFRRATFNCERPSMIPAEGAGMAGTRFIASCANGALVQLGTSIDPGARPSWSGGAVRGTISGAPDHRTWIEAIRDPRPLRLMLVADPPLAGLHPNAKPDPANIPNNHLSYAAQWFLFALTALVIYGLALRKRLAA